MNIASEPAQPRDAASLLLIKAEANTVSILMGKRHASHKFMPNKLVFPGGAVDAADFAAQAASPLPAPVRQKLARIGGLALADALAACCARELLEETGLTLGQPPALAGLDYLCRAVTPTDRAIRFNARFFVGASTAASGVIAGSGELEAIGWYAIDRILTNNLAGATRAVLGQLQIWLAMSQAEKNARPVPALLDRRWQEE